MNVPRLVCATFFLMIVSCSQEQMVPATDAMKIELATTPEIRPEIPSEKQKLDPSIEWIFQMQRISGLMESSEDSNFVSLYDNALAAIYFIHLGEKERAERILDFFNTQAQDEFTTQSGGFYQYRNVEGFHGSRKWLGDNAWLLLALNQYEDTYASSKYGTMQTKLERWIRSLQDTDGGLFGGVNEDGTPIPKVTEGIITAYKAIRGYDTFHQNILQYLYQERWDTSRNILVSWPDNQDFLLALDVHTLGSIIFQELSTTLLEEANHFRTAQELTLTGETIAGYCFDEDLDVVWLEGSAQMAVALQASHRYKKAEEIIGQLEKSFIKSATYEGSHGLPYASNYGTGYGNGLLWDHADITPALSSTLWYRFAKEQLNPLSLNETKVIPEKDQFWEPYLSN